MKSTYKIALLAAAGILLIVIIYFAAQGNREPQPRLADAGSGRDADTAAKANNKDVDGLASNDASSTSPWSNRHRAAPSSATDNGSSATANDASQTTHTHGPAKQTDEASDRAAFLADLKATAAAVRGEGTARMRVPTPDSRIAGQTEQTTLSANGLASAGTREAAGSENTHALARANQTLQVNGDQATDSAKTGTGQDEAHSTANTSATNTKPLGTSNAGASSTDASTSHGASPALAASTKADTYTIKEGDTFTSIARHLYHDEHRWVDISQANPLVDPTRLHVGQKIRLPNPTRLHQRAATTPTPPAVHPRPQTTKRKPTITGRGVTYTVQAGDTLWTIARQYYDDPTQWRTIFDANRRALGNDPNHIDAGEALIIPPIAAQRTR